MSAFRPKGSRFLSRTSHSVLISGIASGDDVRSVTMYTSSKSGIFGTASVASECVQRDVSSPILAHPINCVLTDGF